MKPKALIWQDRRRFFGLPLSRTQYYLSNEQIFVQFGLSSPPSIALALCRIQDIRCTVSPVQRIFGVGTLTLVSSDQTVPQLTLKNIRRPARIQSLIQGRADKAKETRRARLAGLL